MQPCGRISPRPARRFCRRASMSVHRSTTRRRSFRTQFARVRTILTYAQYWVWRLTGIAVNEVTSLGCHTDLWNPQKGDFPSLVDTLGFVRCWRRSARLDRMLGRSARHARPQSASDPGNSGPLRHPRFQCLAAAASDHPHIALLRRIDRNLGGVFCGRRKVGSARPGTRYARQCRCLWQACAVGAVHGRTRIRDRRPGCRCPRRRCGLESGSLRARRFAPLGAAGVRPLSRPQHELGRT